MILMIDMRKGLNSQAIMLEAMKGINKKTKEKDFAHFMFNVCSEDYLEDLNFMLDHWEIYSSSCQNQVKIFQNYLENKIQILNNEKGIFP